jgi:hypothetical protein
MAEIQLDHFLASPPNLRSCESAGKGHCKYLVRFTLINNSRLEADNEIFAEGLVFLEERRGITGMKVLMQPFSSVRIDYTGVPITSEKVSLSAVR